ncbi:hypothetical protein QRD02_10105 [Aequorivita sp. SDUM287046]|uniref:Gliding motility-associated protein GldM N-terminal domain-containing protein n=1 Tax=Aequorivita aurantiaca TaxID=3053356 RepID=A0ABT8DIJ6_9FLAO|nr:hypothetical protein [Aequorivita aurantiaca]MDN3724737.1 hypothetical protein [Aequorivita aurantiaca]
MASKSEVGHKKNVANFSAAYTILEEMGPMYNPTNTLITLENLAPIKDTLTLEMNTLDTKIATYRADVADNENAMEQMDKKATKILNYFKSLNVPQNEIDNIAAQVRKIRGDKRKAPKNPEEGNDHTISNSQQSYDSKVANFNTLIAQLEAFPEYAPNEDEIKTTSLETYTAQLETLRDTLRGSSHQLITARAARNSTLYYNHPNVLELMRFIKNYVKSLGLPAKPYYDALVRLKFVIIRP